MLRVALFYSVVLSPTRRITRADLIKVATAAQTEFVATALSTGNLILSDKASPAALEQRLEQTVASVLGKAIAVIVREADELRTLIAANPFPQETAANPARIGVRLMRQAPAPTSLDRIAAKIGHGERFVAQDRALWLCTDEKLSNSPLLTAVSAAWVGVGTMRSASALGKIVAALPS